MAVYEPLPGRLWCDPQHEYVMSCASATCAYSKTGLVIHAFSRVEAVKSGEGFGFRKIGGKWYCPTCAAKKGKK